jgi:hypothetical protein
MTLISAPPALSSTTFSAGYLSFDDQLEVGLANLDDMPTGQASLLDDVPEEAIPQADQEIASEETVVAEASTPPTPSASMKSQPQPVQEQPMAQKDDSAPLCFNCGNQTQRAGSCYVCTACGSTTGCS